MLARHIKNDDDIFIQVDADCDGFTSAAIFLNWMYGYFPYYTTHHITYRIHNDKIHGIITDTIPNNTKLVIIPDAGSNQLEEHKILHDKGIDVLVIDHHLVDTVSPYACIINNQIDKYPNKNLSGVGMVYKFCSYIDQIMGRSYANNFLDLAALGIIADMVGCEDFETHQIIRMGLQNVTNPFFSEMVRKNSFSLKDELTYEGVAFYIAPQVNATIRVGTQEEKQLLFASMLDYEGYKKIPSTKRGCNGQLETVVEQACRNCVNIKSRQTKARDTSLEIIEDIIEKEHLLDNKILIVRLAEPVERNLTGLIANQLMSKYQRPVLLLNKTINEVGSICWEGSGRNYEKSGFKDFNSFINSSGLGKAEGHAAAFGASFLDKNLEKFIAYSNNKLMNVDFSPCYLVDFIFDANTIRSQDIYELADYKSLWGKNVEEPLIAIENIKLTNNNLTLLSPDRNPTLKFYISEEISAIKFRSNNDEYESLHSALGCVNINVIGRCSRNVYNGISTPQIMIEDYEIVGRTEYYF